MTLLCSYSIGGILSILTSDTRRVMTLGKTLIPIADAESKIHQITDSIVCAGGGYDAISDFVIKELKNKILKPIDTLRIEEFVEDIDEVVQVRFKEQLKDDKPSQILISGFNFLGTSFTLNYVPDEGKGERVSYNVLTYGTFNLAGAFPEGYEGTISSLQEVSHHIHGEMTGTEMAETLLLSIANLQQAIHLAEPNKVSEWLCYSIVLRDMETKSTIVLSDKVNILGKAVNE